MTRRIVAALLVVVPVTLAVLVGSAAAHATLESTSPAAGQQLKASPARVALTFDEAVTTTPASIRLFDGAGDRVDTGRVEADGHVVRVRVPTLDDGTYIVTWRVTSADAHPLHGAFTFEVGAKGATADDDTAALTRKLLADQGGDTAVGFVYAVQRFLVFASVIVVVGGAAFLALVWPAGAGDRRARRVLLAAWITAAVTTALGIGIQGAYGAGLGLARTVDPSVIGDELGTRFGDGSLLRLAFLAVLGVVLLAAVRRRSTSALWGVAFGAGLAILATFGWAGHAATGDLHDLGLPADVVHLAAVAVWLGGLTMLAVCVLPRRDDAELARVVPAFSRLALVCVAVIVATGAFQGWRQTRSIDALDSTTYGRLLIVKVAIFVVLVALAWRARRWVHGRREDASVGAFARTVSLEVALAAAVVVVTGLLVNAQPARTALARPYSTELTAGPLLVDVTVDPAKAGPADIHVYTLDRRGQVKAVDELDVALRLPDRDVGPLAVPVRRAGPGHFAAYGYRLPFPGDWRLAVAVTFTLAAPALAHVRLTPEQAAKGSTATLTFRVPNEKDDASTTKLEIVLPDDHPVSTLMPQPVAGWTEATAGTASATWTANPGAGIPPDGSQDFVLTVGPLPRDTDAFVLKVLQTYSDGEVVRWIELTPPGGAEPDFPAPTLTLTGPAVTTATTAATATPTPATGPTSPTASSTSVVPDTAEDDGGGNGALVAGIVAAAVVVLAVAAYAISRQRRIRP